MPLIQKDTVLQLLIHDFSEALFFWQFVALFASLAIPFVYCWWLRAQFTTKYMTTKGLSPELAKQKSYWIIRGLFPVLSLVILSFAQPLLAPHISITLLRLGVVVQLSWLSTYVVIYSLGRFFPNSYLKTYARYISICVWLFAALYLTGLMEGLELILEDIRLPLGKISISLLDLFYGIFLVLFTLITSLWLGAFIDSRLMQMEQLDMSLRVVLARVVRSTFIVIAILLSMSAAGVDLTLLSVFGGALGVGLGLGLQRIASNYISGFIVLLERSIRIGDVIAVAGLSNGWVTAIRTRYTLIKGFDGSEMMIPNENLVNSPVQTLTAKVPGEVTASLAHNSRQTISLVINSASDLELALQLLVEQASKQERVLQDPPPLALLSAFTPEGFALDLTFSISDPHKAVAALKSAINLDIYYAFRANGIMFAVPIRQIQQPSAELDVSC